MDFLGCIRFPECRFTLPLTSAGRDVRQVLKDKPEASTERPRRPQAKKRATVEASQNSDGSWMPVPDSDGMEETHPEDVKRQINANLTAAEMEVIQRMREVKSETKTLEQHT